MRAVWGSSTYIHTYVCKEKRTIHYVNSVAASIIIKRNICKLCVAMCMYVHMYVLIATVYIHIYIYIYIYIYVYMYKLPDQKSGFCQVR